MKSSSPQIIRAAIRRTDFTDYQRVYDSVRSVCSDYCRRYDDAHFDVNISSGEPIAVAAMVNAMQSFDSDLYYIRDGKVIVKP